MKTIFYLIAFLVYTLALGQTKAYNLIYYNCLFNPLKSIEIEKNNDLSTIIKTKDSSFIYIPYSVSILDDSSMITLVLINKLNGKIDSTTFCKKNDLLYYIAPKYSKNFGIGCSRDLLPYHLIFSNDENFLYYGEVDPKNLIMSW